MPVQSLFSPLVSLGGAAARGLDLAVARSGEVALAGFDAVVDRTSSLLCPSRTFDNWSGTVRVAPRNYLPVDDLPALQRAVRLSSRARCVGAGHSSSPLIATDDTLIDLRKLDKILKVDLDKKEVEVEAGKLLSALDKELAGQGLALRTAPTIDAVTVAGAIATASHGTGLGFGTFANEVVALKLVKANGELEEIGPNDPRLPAARVHLGALGAIYSVTLKIRDAFHLALDEAMIPEDEAFSQLAQDLRDHQHVDLFWFPADRRVFRRVYDETTAPISVPPETIQFIEDELVRKRAASAALRVAGLAPGLLSRPLSFISARAFRPQHMVDQSDKIFHRFPGSAKAALLEYVLPLENFAAARSAIRDCLNETGFEPNVPFYFRFLGGDPGSPLSPNGSRDSVACEVVSALGFDYEPFFRAVEARFADLGGKPHWGKLNYAPIRERYSEQDLAAFESLRSTLDPEGKFKNAAIADLVDTPAANPDALAGRPLRAYRAA